MTAEIAIMNKMGIALAADSAVTIEDANKGDLKKIYNTANKLFMLSKHHPVGIMIYGSAQLLRVPWETIIKVYRKKLGKKVFGTLQEYSSDFTKYLNNFFSVADQESYFYLSVAGFFYNYIYSEIDEKIEETTHEKGEINQDEITNIAKEVVNKHYKEINATEILTCFPKNFLSKISRKYKKVLDRVIDDVFEELPFDSDTIHTLREVGFLLCVKDVFVGGTSGVVIAGFGNNEIFPALYSLNVDGVINGYLKYKTRSDAIINESNEATIVPFAQQEMVYTFMEGVDPNYNELIEGYLERFFEQYPQTLVEGLSVTGLTDKQKKAVLETLLAHSKKSLKKFNDDLLQYRRENYIEPIISNVASLPKDELAAMAESLVNLTSFKRRVSMDNETVGGPIDVAVISKGDGFVWIKRKHYFSPELNHHFFSNYFPNESDL
jgi:hypothetical protein